MYRIAYRIPGANPRTVKDGAAFRRLREQCPDSEDGQWVAWEHPDGGALVVWPGEATSPPDLAAFGEPRETADGLTFYPSREQPDMVMLLRSEVSRPADGSWVNVSTGAALWIPVAVMSERRYVLLASGGSRVAPSKHRFGVCSRELDALYAQRDPKASDIEIGNKEVELVRHAIHAAYQVTDEAIEDIEAFHLSAVDISHICYVAQGYDPKGFAAVLAASRSSASAAESTVSHSLPTSPQLSPPGQSAEAGPHP